MTECVQSSCVANADEIDAFFRSICFLTPETAIRSLTMSHYRRMPQDRGALVGTIAVFTKNDVQSFAELRTELQSGHHLTRRILTR